MEIATLPVTYPAPLEDPDVRATLADARMHGLAENLSFAVSQVLQALEAAGFGVEELPQDTSRVEERLYEALQTLLGAGTGDAQPLTEMALRMEPFGIAFAHYLCDLADEARLYHHRRDPGKAVAHA